MEKVANGKKGSNIISIFEDEVKKIQEGIDSHNKGGARHIAVIAEPYCGKNHILDKITGDNSQKIEDIKLFSPVRNKDFFTNFYTDKEVILLRNSQYLYTRQIGGFDVYKAFLDYLTSSDRLFICGWNRFAWNYLKEISNISDLFPVQIEVPEIDSKSLMKVIMSEVDQKIIFIDDRDFPENEKFWMS